MSDTFVVAETRHGASRAMSEVRYVAVIRQAEAHANDGVPSLGPVDRASLHDSVVERLAELIFDGPLEIGKGRRPLVAAPA